MWAHSIISEYAGIIGKIELAVTSLADQSILQQYQLAEELFPIGIIFIVVGGIVGGVGVLMVDESEKGGPHLSNVRVVSSNVQVISEEKHNPIGIFQVHYLVSGNVANFGHSISGVIAVRFDITSPEGEILFSTDALTTPNTLAPKQEGQFTFEFTSDDLGGYNLKDWTCDMSVVEQ
jgi:hypothetical protein